MALILTLLLQVFSFNISLIPSFGTTLTSITQTTAVYEKEANKVYIFGGHDVSTSEIINSICTFDLNSLIWGEVSSQSSIVPPGLYMANAVMRDSQTFLVFFGSTISGISSDVFQFDLSTNSWSTLTLSGASIPGCTNFGFASFIFLNTSYSAIFGGTTAQGPSNFLYM